MKEYKEIYYQMELYRIIKNTLLSEFKKIERDERFLTEFKVFPEVEVAEGTKKKKVDLVIYKYYSRSSSFPILTIEIKKPFSKLTNPKNSLTRAAKQVKNYSKLLNSQYCAIYDGFYFFLFDRVNSPYLKAIFTAEIDETLNEDLSTSLLLAIKDTSFEKLTNFPLENPSFVEKITYSLIKVFEENPDLQSYQIGKWREIIYRHKKSL